METSCNSERKLNPLRQIQNWRAPHRPWNKRSQSLPKIFRRSYCYLATKQFILGVDSSSDNRLIVTMGKTPSPFGMNSSILSVGASDKNLLEAAKDQICFVRADLHRSVNDVASAVENLRSTDGRLAFGVRLIEEIWRSECVKTTLAEFTPPKQVGGTCYANACAAAIYLANCRILGRNKLSFEQLREKIISRFGYKGANTANVLEQETRENLGGRLRYQEVNEAIARRILKEKRHPIVAKFALTDKQWKRFSEFYRRFPNSAMPEGWLTGIIRLASGNVASDAAQGICGHAVLATSVDEQGNLVLLNSWGADFANNGSFKIKNGAVLNLRFFHVYFLETDLPDHEREFYRLTINYIYAVQKNAREKNPFRPTITRGFDGRYHEDSYSTHTDVNELLEAAGCPSLSDSLDIPNDVDAVQYGVESRKRKKLK